MGGYRRPAFLDEALELLAATPHRVIAGGTDLYPADVAATAWGEAGLGHARAAPLLDISAIAGLRRLTWTDRGLAIGAGVTWSDVVAFDLPPAMDGLVAAARAVGGRQIQNRGTVGGNLCNASPAADGVPPLLTLGAEVELASGRGSRRLPLDRFLLGNRRTARAPDELLVAIHLPMPDAAARGRFLKLGARRYLVISITMVALVLTTDATSTITRARVAVGACSPVALRLAALEADLAGVALEDAHRVPTRAHLADLAPIDDVRASAAYRTRACLELLRRGLGDLRPQVAAA